MKNKVVTIKDIQESIYVAYLDTEYREALAHAIMTLGYVSDSPLNLHFGTEKQKEEIERVESMSLDSNQISEIIHLMMYEMRNDFQYGRFKPIALKFLNISENMKNNLISVVIGLMTFIVIGVFINTLISFLIVSFAVFLLVKTINKLKMEKKEEVCEAPVEPTTKDCPFCCSTINIKAVKCPHCASELK